jgi:hypothetical protein
MVLKWLEMPPRVAKIAESNVDAEYKRILALYLVTKYRTQA